MRALPSRADVLVVGGGLAGLEAAWALGRRGVRSVVVDAAPGDGGDVAGMAPTAGAPPGWRSARPPHYVELGFGPRRMGGRSLYWHGVVVRIEDWALAEPWWPPAVAGALRGDGLVGLYDEVEADLASWAGRGLDDPVTAGDTALAGWLAGSGFASPRPAPRAIRVLLAGRDVYTPLDRWRTRVASSQLVEGWSAVEVLAKRGSTPAVRVRSAAGGDTRILGCERLLIATGTMDATRLVAQLTGRRGRLATGLNDHLVQGFVVLVPAHPALPAAGEGALVVVRGDGAQRSNLFVRTAALSSHAGMVLFDVWAVGEQLPSDSTTLLVDGARMPWTVTVEPGLSVADRDVLVDQQATLRCVWAALRVTGRAHGAGTSEGGALRFGDLLDAPVGFDAALRAVAAAPPGTPVAYAWPLGTVQHEGGSLPLGGELVDEDGWVRGVDGVMVVGPATFPRAGAANPSLTTLALARRAADVIAGVG